MSKTTKVWLIIAASLVLIGCILFAGVMSTLRWDFTNLSTVQYETNTYEISEVFDRISMNTDTADIVFAFSDDGKCIVECHEEENAKHSVTVEDGTLTVELIDERSVSDYILRINIGSPKITIFLPKTEYASLLIHGETCDVEIPNGFLFKNVDISLGTSDVYFGASASETIRIKGGTSHICAENISAGSVDLSVGTGNVTAAGVNCEGDLIVGIATGKVHLSDINCKNLTSSGKTSDISLNNVIAIEKFLIKTVTGDVEFDGCDAAEISIENKTGDVVGNLLTDKVFITEVSTGKIDVPKTMAGGICEIKTGTGDIKITVKRS